MAEIAGLALGAVGLASLFSGCIEAFEHVRVARTQDAALRILSTKLENQKVRFVSWGQACGLDRADGYDPQLDHPIRRDSIRRTMGLVYDLFAAGDALQRRYGLRPHAGPTTRAMAAHDAHTEPRPWRDLFRRIRAKLTKQNRPTTQQQQQQQETVAAAPAGGMVRWTIVDRNAFMSLVTNLRELIDDLDSMCTFYNVREYRRTHVWYEIQSMGDTESLRWIRDASADDDADDMSVAASLRLVELGSQEAQSSDRPDLPQLESSDVEPSAVATGPQREMSRTRRSIDTSRFYTPPGSISQLRDKSASPQLAAMDVEDDREDDDAEFDRIAKARQRPGAYVSQRPHQPTATRPIEPPADKIMISGCQAPTTDRPRPGLFRERVSFEDVPRRPIHRYVGEHMKPTGSTQVEGHRTKIQKTSSASNSKVSPPQSKLVAAFPGPDEAIPYMRDSGLEDIVIPAASVKRKLSRAPTGPYQRRANKIRVPGKHANQMPIASIAEESDPDETNKTNPDESNGKDLVGDNRTQQEKGNKTQEVDALYGDRK